MTSRLTPRLAIGLTLLWLGVFWILEEIGVAGIYRLVDLWPAGIILLAVAIALNGGGWVSTLFVGFVGVWLLSDNFRLFPFDIGDLWPLVLVFIGIRLIMKGTGIRTRSIEDRADRVSSMAILGTRHHQIEGTAFKKADATAILGTSNIDLRNARFADGATIDMFCLAGGVNIMVSPDTRIVSSVAPIMGGYEDKRTGQASPKQTLYLRGVVIWCGIEVMTAQPELSGDES